MLLCIWLYSNWGFHDPIPWDWVPTKYEGQQPISCKAAWHNCSVQPPLSTHVVAFFFLFTWPLNSNMNHREHQSWTRNLLITWSAPNFLLRTGNNFVTLRNPLQKIQRIGAITIGGFNEYVLIFVPTMGGVHHPYFRQPLYFVSNALGKLTNPKNPFTLPTWVVLDGIQSHPIFGYLRRTSWILRDSLL